MTLRDPMCAIKADKSIVINRCRKRGASRHVASYRIVTSYVHTYNPLAGLFQSFVQSRRHVSVNDFQPDPERIG